MPPLAGGDFEQGHLSDTAFMQLLENQGDQATLCCTADPRYRLDPPTADRSIGRFSKDVTENPSAGAMAHDLRQILGDIAGSNVDTEIEDLRTQLEGIERSRAAPTGGNIPLLFRQMARAMPSKPNPCYAEGGWPAYNKR